MDFLEESPALLSAAVFLARVLDVSLGVFRAYRVRAALIGFVEILIWVAAVGIVLRDLSAWYVAVSYAGGFAAGNYVGIWLESKLAMGMELVRTISASPEIALAKRLRENDFSVTELDGYDDEGTPVAWNAAFEKLYLQRVLKEQGGKVAQAAAQIGIDPRSLYSKMRALGLRKEDFR